ncbi:DUF1365 domain-containing protein [bacterium]|nr:DUF1365 domain-containing protein [bacterium]
MAVNQSNILTGTLIHERLTPKKHRFAYRHYWLAISLEELSILNKSVIGFSHNRFNWVSIYDSDYLGEEPKSILEKVDWVIKEKAFRDQVVRVVLVTSPRFLGIRFNPVNLYYLYDNTDEILGVVAEVSNTFGETHLYVLENGQKIGKFPAVYSHIKEFYVSPFNDLKGHYDFFLTNPTGEIDIRINLIRDGRAIMLSQFKGGSIPMSSRGLWATILGYPLTGLTTFFLISINALILKLKGVKSLLKPHPSHPFTYRVKGDSHLDQIHERPAK